jgi:hypothetical protein
VGILFSDMPCVVFNIYFYFYFSCDRYPMGSIMGKMKKNPSFLCRVMTEGKGITGIGPALALPGVSPLFPAMLPYTKHLPRLTFA